MEKIHNEMPTLWIVTRSWWSNKAALNCASLKLPLLLMLFLTSSIALSLPFAASRLHDTALKAQPAQYPGLGNAFETLAHAPFSFRIIDGNLQLDEPIVQPITVKDWTIELGSNNATLETTKNILRIDDRTLLIRNGTTGIEIRSSLTPLEGLSSSMLKQAAQDRQTLSEVIEALLYTAAFSSTPSTLFTLLFIMIVQNLIFVIILGLLLSFAVYRRKYLEILPANRYSLLENIKMVIAITTGPAYILGILGFIIPYVKAPFLWFAYSLLAAIRVIMLYTNRYISVRNF